MKNVKFLYVIASILIYLLTIQTDSYAAYVGNPLRTFAPEGEKKTYSIYVEGIADIIYDRGAKHQTDDMKVDFYGGSAGVVYKDVFVLYGGAGAAKVEETYTILDKKIRWESDYGPTWLAGCTFKLYEENLKNFHNSKLSISLDVQCRNTDLDPDTITIDSVEYNIPHTSIDYSSMEYNDWHTVLACGLDMGIFSPYIGIKYSDFESTVRVMQDGTLYQKDNAEADDNFGVFIGVSVKTVDALYINIEASFIDEDSLSGSLSWKF